MIKTMKKKYFILTILMSCFFTIGCDKSETTPNGDIDPALLIGEWDCVKFTYITGGNKIFNESNISKGILKIPYAPTPIEHNPEDRWKLDHSNSNWFVCSLDGNSINLEHKGSTLMSGTPEEDNIVKALMNVYSFVIKDNELMLYFEGTEVKNLLILKKR